LTAPETADVLVVGAGPAGAVVTKRLAEAGVSVVCLEQGDWPDYSKARAGHPDFELTAQRDWAWNPNARCAPGDYPIDDSESDAAPQLWNGVGGGSVVYAGVWERNLPSDFRVRTLDGVGDDWPLTYDELLPYYERVERDFGVSGIGGDPALPPGAPPPLPPVPLGRIGRLGARAHNELGWHWWPGPNAIATRPYRKRSQCVQRTACLWACPEGAKGSVDRTHWPAAIERGAQLVTGARVVELAVERGRVVGAVWIDRGGRRHLQRASATVLAANAVGTPRLLLASEVANSSGLVGRRLMIHPWATVTGLFDEDVGGAQGPWGQLLHCLEFYETDVSRGFVRGAKWGLMVTGGPVSAVFAPFFGHPVLGDGFHAAVRSRLGRSAMWGIVGEDLPDEHNRVELHERLTDDDGLPAPRLVHRSDPNAERLMAFNVERAQESLRAMGAYETIVGAPDRETGWHLLGTARMGIDPATSVVDPYGRSHDVPNLWIADGSTWPTSAAVNPTATIAALALRTAERLLQTRREPLCRA
jgi:choline dehydrogenase-like flavoprotein